jgi:hypothetical protein
MPARALNPFASDPSDDDLDLILYNGNNEAGEVILDETAVFNANLLTAILLRAEGHLERTGDIL